MKQFLSSCSVIALFSVSVAGKLRRATIKSQPLSWFMLKKKKDQLKEIQGKFGHEVVKKDDLIEEKKEKGKKVKQEKGAKKDSILSG